MADVAGPQDSRPTEAGLCGSARITMDSACPLVGTGFAYKGHPVADLTHNTVPGHRRNRLHRNMKKATTGLASKRWTGSPPGMSLKAVWVHTVTIVHLQGRRAQNPRAPKSAGRSGRAQNPHPHPFPARSHTQSPALSDPMCVHTCRFRQRRVPARLAPRECGRFHAMQPPLPGACRGSRRYSSPCGSL